MFLKTQKVKYPFSEKCRQKRKSPNLRSLCWMWSTNSSQFFHVHQNTVCICIGNAPRRINRACNKNFWSLHWTGERCSVAHFIKAPCFSACMSPKVLDKIGTMPVWPARRLHTIGNWLKLTQKNHTNFSRTNYYLKWWFYLL